MSWSGRFTRLVVRWTLVAGLVSFVPFAPTNAGDLLELGKEIIRAAPEILNRDEPAQPPDEPPPDSETDYQTPPKETRETRTKSQDIEQPSVERSQPSRSLVRETQQLLNELGYSAGTPDGVMGSKTKRAIERYQADSGLPVTGIPDDKLVSHLREQRATASTAPSRSTQPSFDCDAVTSVTEIAICDRPRLAALDREISDAYGAALSSASPGERAALKAEQIRWMKSRNECGGKIDCLERSMTERREALRGDVRLASAAEPEPSAPEREAEPTPSASSEQQSASQSETPTTPAAPPSIGMLKVLLDVVGKDYDEAVVYLNGKGIKITDAATCAFSGSAWQENPEGQISITGRLNQIGPQGVASGAGNCMRPIASFVYNESTRYLGKERSKKASRFDSAADMQTYEGSFGKPLECNLNKTLSSCRWAFGMGSVSGTLDMRSQRDPAGPGRRVFLIPNPSSNQSQEIAVPSIGKLRDLLDVVGMGYDEALAHLRSKGIEITDPATCAFAGSSRSEKPEGQVSIAGLLNPAIDKETLSPGVDCKRPIDGFIYREATEYLGNEKQAKANQFNAAADLEAYAELLGRPRLKALSDVESSSNVTIQDGPASGRRLGVTIKRLRSGPSRQAILLPRDPVGQIKTIVAPEPIPERPTAPTDSGAGTAESAPATAAKDSFDGITIIRLDEDARIAIAGGYGESHLIQESYLAVFMSPQGSYASVDRACVAWSAAGVQDGGSITFGIKLGTYQGKPEGPPWCQPFTVEWQGGDKVRVVAENEVQELAGNAASDTRPRSHDGVHDVVVRAPLAEPAFDLPPFSKHALQDIRLGPVPKPTGEPEISIGPLRRTPLGHHKEYLARFDSVPGLSFGREVRGKVAAAEVTGWTSDSLIASFSAGQLATETEAQGLANDFIERFGTLSAGGKNQQFNHTELFWLYDLDGKLLAPSDRSPDNCAQTIGLWHGGSSNFSAVQDIGPWGCSLVVFLSFNAGEVGRVSDDPLVLRLFGSTDAIRVETIAGHASGINHFLTRLEELAEARAKLGVAADAGATGAGAGASADEGAAAAAASQPSLAPNLSSVDLFAPGGAAIGMPVDQAEAALAASGIARTPDNARLGLEDVRTTIRVVMDVDSSTAKVAPPRGVVNLIEYAHESLDVDVTAAEVIARATEQAGSEPDCPIREKDHAYCRWTRPANHPLIDTISLTLAPKLVRTKRAEGPGAELSIRLTAVKDLAARLASPAKTSPALFGDTIDPLAPEGVAIGMTLGEARAALSGKGFRSSGCEFFAKRDGGDVILVLRMPAHEAPCNTHGRPERLFYLIDYTVRGVHVTNSVDELIGRMSNAFGAEPKSCSYRTVNDASCYWEPVPTAPFLFSANLRVGRSDLQLQLNAVAGLETRVTRAPTPAPPQREQLWWERDLAKAEADAKGASFELAREYPGVTPEVGAKIGAEAKVVYDYCGVRQPFSLLRDCRCVAERFMDKRAKSVETEPWREGSKNELIGIADEVAGECPNKAGAARYGYEQCTAMYQTSLPNNWATYCTCHADRFAQFYMENKLADFQSLTNYSSAAIMTCSEEIRPNPLNQSP